MKRFSLSLAMLGLAACGGSPRETNGSQGKRTSVIVVSLDTTRADRIGVYGYSKAQTDTIDALSAKGRRFTRAYSPVPLTIPAHASLFTGLNPHHHGVRSNSTEVLGEEVQTMAELLRDEGYQTWASVSAFVTQSSWGFGQGFDQYAESLGRAALERHENAWREERTADEVVDDAIGFLQAREDGKPYFLWVHMFDAHEPLQPPASYLKEGVDPYDAEIAFMDDQIERLQRAVGSEDVLWVILADHGESLGEHDEQTHGLFVYNSTQHIPLIMSGGGMPADVQEEPVSLVDVLPTVLRHLEFDVPKGLDGAPQPGNPQPIYMESYELTRRFGWAPHIGLVDGDIKLIELPVPELYAQAADPQEAINLAETDPVTLERLQGVLEQFSASPPEVGADSLDAQTAQKLSALGYVQGRTEVREGLAVDPKERRGVLRAILAAKGVLAKDSVDAGVLQNSITALREVLVTEPNLLEGSVTLARLLEQAGETRQAIRVYEQGLERRPESVNWMLNAAVLHGSLRQFDKAEALARKAYSLEPGSVRALELLMTALFYQKRQDEAIALGAAFLDESPESAVIAGFMGAYLASKFDYKEESDFLQVQKYLRQGLEARFPRQGIRYHLAIMAHAAKATDDVILLAEAELVDYPASHRMRRLLVRVLGESKRYSDQVPHLEILFEQDPESMQGLHALAQGLWNAKRFGASEALVADGLAKSPSHPELLMLKANILSKKGDEAAAQAAYQAALAAKKAE
jgi:arylsulfatase A-like enzyme/lipopolysaccharide biosynthesis regulator YciM